MSAIVCLFAHQDDEFGLFQTIKSSVELDHAVYCLYFTDGGKQSTRRNKESITVLKRLGVSLGKIMFIGGDNHIGDLSLKDNFKMAALLLTTQLEKISAIDAIYTPAWEGGHPDHDALHAIAVEVMKEKKWVSKLYQYPLYNNAGCVGNFFKVLSPLKANGEVFYKKIPWVNRLIFLRLCLKYHSQRKTWFGLFPFVAWHYFFKGKEACQSVSIKRRLELPSQRPLYYEVRRFTTWDVFNEKLSVFLNENSHE